MDTKLVGRKAPKGEKARKTDADTLEEVISSEDLSVASADNVSDKTKSKKKKSKPHEGTGGGVATGATPAKGALPADTVGLDDNESKKRKRKLELGGQMKDSMQAGEKYGLSGNGREVNEAIEDLRENPLVVESSVSEATELRKKSSKEKESKKQRDSVYSLVNNIVEDNRSKEVVGGLQGPEEKDNAVMSDKEGGKKKKKREKRNENGDNHVANKHYTDHVEVGNGREGIDNSTRTNLEFPSKEIKRTKKKHKVASPEKIMAESLGTKTISMEGDGSHAGPVKSKAGEINVVVDTVDTEDGNKDLKKKKRKRDKDGSTGLISDGGSDGINVMDEREDLDRNVIEEVEYSEKALKKKKKKKKHRVVEVGDASGKTVEAKLINESSAVGGNEVYASGKTVEAKLINESSAVGGNEVYAYATKSKEGDVDAEEHAANTKVGDKVERKKVKSMKNGSEGKGSKRLQKSTEEAQATGPSENSISKRTSKRVSFSEDVEVFPLSDGPSDAQEGIEEEDGLVRGKRFTLEEDEKIKRAVYNYIETYNLGEDGLDMVMNCSKHPEIRHCWKEIAAALPHRPQMSVYYRGHILLERAQNRKWTQEEYDVVRQFYEKHGPDWKTLAAAMGKHRFHVKEAWRRIRLTKEKKGRWSQEEYQSLFNLVNEDLRMKALAEVKKSKHGMLRDNIGWMAISDRLETRTDATCCVKWYSQLSSPLVAEGNWSDIDDYRLLIALYNLDAFCMEDVDWDNLLENRSGYFCRKRWNQMVKHLGEHKNESFSEQIEVLLNRYCPDVLEAREEYNSKPVVN
ncbi:hypothetical protein Tsubulata_006417 [Turnera subulata]|uniref:Myb-like domain-containing protein n=1 Tax=Turnera subulata TaxID=218843 RepID=A0A9Q0EZF6_9ROSI|nr:hypothetical protein Tsubulata_006417 [Turnera subulata]